MFSLNEQYSLFEVNDISIVKFSNKRSHHFCVNFSFDMTSITRFYDLPDLFFIELFDYLSQIDILLALTNLDNRIELLIRERGYSRQIDFSLICLSKFVRLLCAIPLNHIETLIINVEASPLQLSRWPYLP